MEHPMQKLNDLSRSLAPLEPDGMLIAVIEMSQSSWLVAGIVPGVERQPLKKLAVDESASKLFVVAPPAQACTGIRLIAADGTVVYARTLEFGIDLKSDAILVPRGYSRTGTTPDADVVLEAG